MTSVSCRIVNGQWSRFGVFIFRGLFNHFNFRTLFFSLLSLLDFLTPVSLTLHEHASLLELSGPGADWRAWRLSQRLRIGLFHDMMCSTHFRFFISNISVLAIFYLSVVRHGVDVRMWTCVLKSSNGCGVSSLGV